MKNNFTPYWGNYLSIAAIICSIIAICVSLPSKEPLSIDYIGVIVGILSLLVTALLGWQIWNSIAIEKKIKEEVKKVSDAFKIDIDKTRDEMAISGVRATSAALYQIEGINLKICIGSKDCQSTAKALSAMVGYALATNEQESLSDIARLIVNSNLLLEQKGVDCSEIYIAFLELARTVLTRISASDEQVPRLYHMTGEIQKRMNQEKK